MKKIPLAKPIIGQAEIRAVTKVLKSGNLSLGPLYKKFEKQFARRIGTKYACAVSSGTAGLHLMIIAAGIKAGEEIITTPFSFVASANSILYVGAKPVFVDIDPLTYNIDPALIEKAITKKTKAILVVHMFGQPANMDPILRIAKKYHLVVLEDACESLGATYRGENVGTFGKVAVFAFYPNKQITTGEGGMIVTNNKQIYDLCSALRNQGRTENMQWLDHKYLGYNYRLNELSAALGIEQLKKLEQFIQARRRICNLYNKYLQKYHTRLQYPRTAPGNTHTWFVYVVALKGKVNRDLVIKKLKRKGIASKPYVPAIHLLQFYRKKFRFRPGAFPITETLSRRTLALPLPLKLKESDIKYIVKSLISSLS